MDLQNLETHPTLHQRDPHFGDEQARGSNKSKISGGTSTSLQATILLQLILLSQCRRHTGF